MTDHLDVVPAREPDLAVLFGLAHAAFADSPGWNGGRTLRALQEDAVFLAQEEGIAAGFVSLRHEDARTMLIEQLLVAPGHEGHGVGHRLLGHAEGYAIAERAETLAIVVEDDNWRARSFYRRMGFIPAGREVFERPLPQRP